jgi:hypothetical protein
MFGSNIGALEVLLLAMGTALATGRLRPIGFVSPTRRRVGVLAAVDSAPPIR